MSKTYEQYMEDCRADIESDFESEGDELDLGFYMDIAANLLRDPVFRTLAVRNFERCSEFELEENIAHSLC